MIKKTIYKYSNNSWQKISNWANPLLGSNKLDETLDNAVIELKNQIIANDLLPFTKIKIVVSDGLTTKSNYYVTGSPIGDKVRMS